MEADESVQQLTKKNRQNQQKMRKFKQRIQKSLKRPSPTIQLSQISKKSRPLILDISNHHTPQSNPDSIIEESREISDIHGSNYNFNGSNNQKKQSFDYNSTLFKNIQQEQSNYDSTNNNNTYNNDRQYDEYTMNNYSGISVNSVSKVDNNYNILSKVDQVLENVRRDRSKKKNVNAVDQFIQRKSNLFENSSGFSRSQESNSYEYQHDNLSNYRTSPMLSARSNKLKTIQQQKQTLTIDRDEQDYKKVLRKLAKQKIHNDNTQKDKTNITKNNKNISGQKNRNQNYPPLANNITSTVQRQKKKLQEMMSETLGIDHHKHHENQKDIYYEKQSIVFDLSDNQSEMQNSSQVQNHGNNEEINKQCKQDQNSIKRKQLEKQKQLILQEIQAIDRRLMQLQDSQEEDQ